MQNTSNVFSQITASSEELSAILLKVFALGLDVPEDYFLKLAKTLLELTSSSASLSALGCSSKTSFSETSENMIFSNPPERNY